MRSRLVIILLAGLVLAACGPAPIPAPASARAPAATSAATPAVTVQAATLAPTVPTTANEPAPVPTLVRATPTVAPPATPSTVPPSFTPTIVAQRPPSTPTVGPSPAPTGVPATLRAWAIAPSGDIFALDARGAVHQFGPDLQQAVVSGGGSFGPRDIGPGYLAVSDAFVVKASGAVTRTIVLGRPALDIRADYPGAGPLAIDGAKRFYVLYNDAVWSYKLDDLSAPPVPVTTWPVDPFTPRPRNLAIDQQSRQLIVTMHDVSASPPHQREWYQAYNLDSLLPTVRFAVGLGELTPASAGKSGIVAGLWGKNGLLGSTLTMFDRDGKELRSATQFDGRPVADPAGDYIYVLRDRGTWVLKGSDLGLVAFDPYAGNPPLDLLLSPDGSKLYSLFDGATGVQDTAAIRAAGIAPRQGPLLWFLNTDQTGFMRPRFFPAPGAPDTAFVQVGGYGETWRSEDHGRSWAMLPGSVYPNFHYSPELSISPDFAADATLVAVAYYQESRLLRSLDGGDTWAAYDPPVAFMSERDGNREIYTADRGKLGSGEATNIVRRTNSAAAEENPAWSPAWARLAFQSNRSGNWDIYTIRADCDPGGDAAKCDERRVTDDPADDMLPAWSPDGRWIAFVSTRSGQAEIWVAPSAGGPATRLTTSGTGAWRPAWLPDSQRMLYTATQANGSNDIVMGRLVEGADGKLSMPEIVSLVNSPADERDASVGSTYFVYLSNETGAMRTYRRFTGETASSFPTTGGTEPEGHPAVVDDDNATVLVTLERNGQTGIYRATSNGYEPFVVGPQFNGQPAAGPVPWQPDPEWSAQRAKSWQQ